MNDITTFVVFLLLGVGQLVGTFVSPPNSPRLKWLSLFLTVAVFGLVAAQLMGFKVRAPVSDGVGIAVGLLGAVMLGLAGYRNLTAASRFEQTHQ